MSYKDKETAKEAHGKYYRKNRERIIARTRKSYFLRKYGITPEQYEELWIKGKAKCAICEKSLFRGEGTGKNSGNAHLDHDHETGKVREFLCTNDNLGLGFFKHNPDILRKAADYLEKHNEEGKGEDNGKT